MSRPRPRLTWLPLWTLLFAWLLALPGFAASLKPDKAEIDVGEETVVAIAGKPFIAVVTDWEAGEGLQMLENDSDRARVKGAKAGDALVKVKINGKTYKAAIKVVDAGGDGKGDPRAVKLMGLMRGMGFPTKETRIARLLFEVTNEIRGADSFYKELGDMGAKMTDVIAVRSKLVDMPDSTLARQVMGPAYPEGGTLVEQRILTWRKQQTLEAINDVLSKFSGRVPADGVKLIVSHVGKWATQDPRSLQFPGDIDFSFVSNDIALAQEMRAEFLEVIKQRTKMDQISIDSVCTAHGKAGLEVYIGKHGMAFAEEQMKINQIVDLEKGTRRQAGLEEVADVLTQERDMLDSQGKEPLKPAQNTEPGLSMEMVRHFDHDIAKSGIFDVTNAVVKAAKYLDRSYNSLNKSGGKPADPKLAEFAKQITEWANTKPQTAQIREDMIKLISEQLGSPPRTVWDGGKQRLMLSLDAAAIKAFHAEATKAMWKTVEQGSKTRTFEMDTRLRDLLDRQRKGEQLDEDAAKLREDMKSLVDMVEAEIKAIHGGMDIPVSVQTNNAKVRGMLDTLSKRFGTKILSPDELKDKKFVEELLKAQAESPSKTRAEMLKAYIMERTAKAAELSMKGVEKANQFLDIIDDGLLGPLRGDGEYAAVEAEVKAISQAGADPKGRQEAASRLAVLKGMAANGIKAANQKINAALQATAAGRQGMKFMAVYGLMDEMQAYRDSYNEQGWGGLATEFFRRRIPLGSSLENAIMGNTYRAGWDFITTLVPPLGLPEAAYGLGVSIGTTAQSTYWSEQLSLFVDTLYQGAKFELQAVETHGTAKIGVYRLVSVSHPRHGRNIDLSAFAKQRQEQIKALNEQIKTPSTKEKRGGLDWAAYKASFHGLTSWIEVDKILQNNLAATDPVLVMLEEMITHPSVVGSKQADYLAEKGLVRWEEVKLGFITNLIIKLEERRQADQALGAGQLPDLFAELRKTAAELEIEDAMLRGLDAEVDTNNLKALVNWLWDTKRAVLGQAPKESETLRAAQVVKKYLDSYKAILMARNELAGTLSAAAARDGATRYLTGELFLSGRADADMKAAEAWTKQAAAARIASSEALLAIKKEFLPKAALDAEDDKFLERVYPRELWMKPWKDAGSRSGKTWQLDVAIAHGKARNAILDEYRAWLEKQAPVELTVTLLDALDAKRQINNASGDLRPTDELGKPGVGKASGNTLVFGVPTGRYRLSVKAAGYDEAGQDLVLGRGLNPAPKLSVSLMPSDKKADGKLDEFIATALKARDWKRLAERLDTEKKSPAKLQNPAAWQAGIDALTRALDTLKDERMQWALGAEEYLRALDNVDSSVWDKLTRQIEKKREAVEERCYQNTSSSEAYEKRKTRCQNEGRQFDNNCLGTWPDRHWQERTAIRVAKQEVPEQVHTLHSAGYFSHRAWFEAVEKMTEKYKLPFPFPKPVVPRLKYSEISCASVDLPGAKPGDGLSLLKVTIAAPEAVIPMGKAVSLNASASGGKAPYRFTWSTGAGGERASVTPGWAGEWTVTVTATDADGKTGEGRATLRVSPQQVKLLGTQPRVFYGSQATLSLPGKEPPPPAADPCAGRSYTGRNPFDECLRIDADDLKRVSSASPGAVAAPDIVSDPNQVRALPENGPAPRGGKQRVVWQSEPAVGFAPPTSDNGRTRVTYSRMGKVKLWCEIQEMLEGAYHTVGECDQETVEVVAPKFAVTFTPPEGQGRIGQDIRLRISSEPSVPDDLIDFRWFDPATSNRLELTPNAREIGFKAKDAKPVVFKALARVPHHGDSIADIAATYTGMQFQVKAWAEEPGTRPMMWDPVKGGLKPVPRGQYATHERIPLRAELQGGGAPSGVRWSWTVNDGTTISNPISQTPTVSRSSAGSVETGVEARDAQGALLGNASVTLSVMEVRDTPPGPVNPTVSLSADRGSVERGAKVNFTASASGGKPPYSYAWQGASGQGSKASLTASQLGSLTVSVTVSDSKGNKGTASANVDVTENQADRNRKEAARLGEQARARLGQNDLPGAIRLAKEARGLDANAAAEAASEVAAAAKKAGWEGVYDRDFSRVIPNLEAAHELNPADKDAQDKLERARRFAPAWPQVEARAREFDAQMAQKKYFSAHKTLLAMQELQRDMPGTSEKAPNTRIQRDFDAGMAEYNRSMRQVEETHARAAREENWALMLENAETALQREHSLANENSLRSNAEFARRMLRQQAETKAKQAGQPLSLAGVGGQKGTPRTVKGVSVDDSSGIRFKSTDEKRLALDIPVPTPTQAAAVAIVSNLDDATYLEQGKTIARVIVTKDTGVETLEIQAGVHSSEWNYGVGPKHKRVDSADIGDNRFLSVLPLVRPGLVRAIRVEYVETGAPKWSGHAPGFVLRGISLVGDTRGMTLTPAGTSTGAGGSAAIRDFAWLGMSEDRVGDWGNGKPNGTPDGRFRLTLDLGGGARIASIAVYSANERGDKTGGQVWHSQSGSYWMLGVFRDGRQLNTSHVASLGDFAGQVSFDLYANSSGWFNRGQWFLVEVATGNGQVVSRTLRLDSPASVTGAGNVAGKWRTSEGELTLTQNGRAVQGSYSSDGGEIVGEMSGNVLEGYWVENGSAERCATARNGRFHWGRIRWTFDGNKFAGTWSYCDKPVASGGGWSGERIGDVPAGYVPPAGAASSGGKAVGTASDEEWTVVETTPGMYRLERSSGEARIARQANNPGGLQHAGLRLNRGLPASGDFNAQVSFADARIDGGLNQIELQASFADGSIFYVVRDRERSGSHIWAPNLQGDAPCGKAGVLRMERRGDTVTGYCDGRAIWSAPRKAALTRLQFVLQNNASNDAISVTFRDWRFGTAANVSTGTTPIAVSGPGLIAAYPLDGDGRDASGNNRHGNVQGAKSTADRFGRAGGAMQFDGRSFIELPLDINPAVYPRLTFTAWVRPDDASPVRQVMSHDNGGYDRSLGIDTRGGGHGWSAFAGSGGVLGFKPVEKGRWTFVAAVWDQPARKVRLVVDDTVLEKDGEAGSSDRKLSLGRNPGYGEHFVGAIDDVRLYGRALDQNEIRALRGGQDAVDMPGGRDYTYRDGGRAQGGFLRIEACVDGSDWIGVENGRLVHKHRGYDQIGTHGGCPASHRVAGGGFLVDGLPIALNRLPLPVGFSGIARFEVERGRGSVRTDGANRLLLDDDAPGGSDVYIIRIYPDATIDMPTGRDYTYRNPTGNVPPPATNKQAPGLLEQVDSLKDSWKELKGLFGK